MHKNTYYIKNEIKGENSNGDDIHFCRESLHILGKRYFEAFKAIQKGKSNESI